MREAETGADALAAARADALAAAIVQVELPVVSGYEVCHTLREERGDSFPIVLLSATRTESYDRVAGLLIGADDYVPKPAAADELLARLRRLTRRSAAAPPPRSPGAALTKRELEVLDLLAAGLRQDEIAERLFISTRTVGTHIEHILGKLGVRSRTQAVALAYRDELIAPTGRN